MFNSSVDPQRLLPCGRRRDGRDGDHSVTATMGGTTVGVKIDNFDMLTFNAPAMAVVVAVPDEALVTDLDTVDHDDVSQTYTIAGEAGSMPSADGDIIVDTNDRDMGTSTIQGLAGDDVITGGAGNGTLFGNIDAVPSAAADGSDTPV